MIRELIIRYGTLFSREEADRLTVAVEGVNPPETVTKSFGRLLLWLLCRYSDVAERNRELEAENKSLRERAERSNL